MVFPKYRIVSPDGLEIPAQIEDKELPGFGVSAETVNDPTGTELNVYILALLQVTPFHAILFQISRVNLV